MRYASYRASFVDDGDATNIVGPCIICKEQHAVRVLKTELEAYKRGEKIQDALRSVSTNGREFLMSGTCPKCWDAMFKTTDEETDNASEE